MNSPLTSSERLNFRLPEFARIAWVSTEAHDIWAPRVAKIRVAWEWIEWLAVLRGLRRCASARLTPDAYIKAAALWAEHGLSSLPLTVTQPERQADSSAQKPSLITVVVGRLVDVRSFEKAWVTENADAMGALFGYPPCCRKSFESRVAQGLLDPIWTLAALSASDVEHGDRVEVCGSPFTNVLWRSIGVRMTSHVPCGFGCGATIDLARRHRAIGVAAGAAEEMEWTERILGWPAEWSALHGIAEIKTPILKVSTRCDATAHKRVVRWNGEGYPDEGAQGLSFPYGDPSHLHASNSHGFQRGLQQIRIASAAEFEWQYRDNGFSSFKTMERYHTPVVTLARQQLEGVSGAVLDLGCGNGALLRSICKGRDDLIPCGVDVNCEVVERARKLTQDAAPSFRCKDAFALDVWSSSQHYALAIISIRLLTHAGAKSTPKLLASIRRHCDRLLVHLYDDPGKGGLDAAAHRAGVKLSGVVDGIAAMVILAAESALPRAALAAPTTSTSQHTSTRTLRPNDLIDWSRIAEPQADHYDTEVVLRLHAEAVERGNIVASPPSDPTRAGARLFGGRVAVVNRPEGGLVGERFLPAPCDHKNLANAERYLQVWPEIATQFPRLVHTIQPWNDTTRTPEEWLLNPGSSSHSLDNEFGTIMVTVDSALGLANAMVHEMAHHKLKAVGVFIHCAKRLIVNDPRELYFSPIKGQKRPMTALLHAQYSFIHVVHLESGLQASELLPLTEKRKAIPRFAWHVACMEQGYEVLGRSARTDADGSVFLDAFMTWSRRVLDHARELLPDARVKTRS